MRLRDQMPKMSILFALVLIWAVIAVVVFKLADSGMIKRAPHYEPPPDTSTDNDEPPVRLPVEASLRNALSYVDRELRRPNGHIELYKGLRGQAINQANHTNSEAVSYYLQIVAQEGDKERFDAQLAFVEQKMLEPYYGYMMWRLDDKGVAEGEGRNIAPDADLRALRALYAAKDRWGDPKYDAAIDRIATGLERVAIKDDVVVAWAGVGGGNVWQGDESYLSYTDFQVLDRLANTRGGVWINVSEKMRNVTLGAQIWNGLYNTNYLIDKGEYGSSPDGGHYSINSLWIMVRMAESNDPVLMESARKSLEFYKDEYSREQKVYASYDSSGKVADQYESPWVYALIARAAYALGDKPFAGLMEQKMLDYQDVDDTSPTYGAIIEGAQNDERVGQFTMQESILTMQEALGRAPRFNS